MGRLYDSKQRLDNKLENMKLEKDQADAAQCTFKPTLVARPASAMASCGSEALYKYSKQQRQTRKEKEQLAATEKRLKDLSDCTFKPVTNSTLASPRASLQGSFITVNKSKLSEALASKLEKANTPKTARQAYRPTTKANIKTIASAPSRKSSNLSNFTTVFKASKTSKPSSRGSAQSLSTNLSRQPSIGSLHTSRTVSQKQSIASAVKQSQLSIQPEEDEVLLSLKVNISPKLFDTLTILEGDNPAAAVEAFTKKHKLTQTASDKLKQHVETHLASLS